MSFARSKRTVCATKTKSLPAARPPRAERRRRMPSLPALPRNGSVRTDTLARSRSTRGTRTRSMSDSRGKPDAAQQSIAKYKRHSASAVRQFAKLCADIHEDNSTMGARVRETTEKLQVLCQVMEARKAGIAPPMAVAKRSGRYSKMEARSRSGSRCSMSSIPCPSGTLAFCADAREVRARRARSVGGLLPPVELEADEALPGDSVWVYLPHSPPAASTSAVGQLRAPKSMRKRRTSAPARSSPRLAGGGGGGGIAALLAQSGGGMQPHLSPLVHTVRSTGSDGTCDREAESGSIGHSPARSTASGDVDSAQHRGDVAVAAAAALLLDDSEDELDTSMVGVSVLKPVPIDWCK